LNKKLIQIVAISVAGALLVGFAIMTMLRPTLAAYFADKSPAQVQSGDIDEAVANCRTAISLDPTLARAHSDLGYALFKQGTLTEAKTECRTAIRLDADDATGHFNLGLMLAKEGQVDEAIKECKEAVRIKPTPSHMNGLAYSYYRQGNIPQAKLIWQTVAMDDDPKAANEANEWLSKIEYEDLQSQPTTGDNSIQR
jgi:Flp pilus assembly protein TadD